MCSLLFNLCLRLLDLLLIILLPWRSLLLSGLLCLSRGRLCGRALLRVLRLPCGCRLRLSLPLLRLLRRRGLCLCRCGGLSLRLSGCRIAGSI